MIKESSLTFSVNKLQYLFGSQKVIVHKMYLFTHCTDYIDESYSGFSQRDKIGNIGIIAKFVFPHICNFRLNLHHMMLVNLKLDIIGCNGTTFQGCRLHWFSFFLMVHIKQS